APPRATRIARRVSRKAWKPPRPPLTSPGGGPIVRDSPSSVPHSPAETLVNDQIRKIQEHIYAKYVDPSDHGTLDEEAALRVLEEYYKSPEHSGDSECFFPGILYFELGFAAEEKQ